MSEQLPSASAPTNRMLTAAEFHQLADVPPEVEWFANLTNPQHAARLRERREGLHAVHRHRAAGGIPHRDPRARHRLARRAGARRGARRQHDPAPARVARLAVRISVRARTPSPTTRSKASSGRGRKAAKARRRRSATTRRASCWPRRRPTPSRASATAPSCPRCCSTRCGARSCASSRCATSGTRAKACRT